MRSLVRVQARPHFWKTGGVREWTNRHAWKAWALRLHGFESHLLRRMKTIHLIRHGQKKSGPGDPGLTQIGIEQAKQTGFYLKQFPIDQIIGSPFKRTKETATHLSRVLELDFSLDEALVERMRWQDKNVSHQEFHKEWHRASKNRSYQPCWGVSSREKGRIMAHFIKKLKPTTSQQIILVTHGGAIIDYLRSTFGNKRIRTLRQTHDKGQDYQLNNCSITTIEYQKQPELKKLNFVEHLTIKSE